MNQRHSRLDSVLVPSDGFCDGGAKRSAVGYDLMVPPGCGDLKGFPPAILTTGARDLLLSKTVRAHRRPCQAGEGQSHAQIIPADTAPKTEALSGEIARCLFPGDQRFPRHRGVEALDLGECIRPPAAPRRARLFSQTMA